LLGIFYDAAGSIDRAFERIEIAEVVFHGPFGATAQGCGLDQTVLAERGDIVTVLAREATDFANREVERAEERRGAAGCACAS
jgi:hypothetical protein